MRILDNEYVHDMYLLFPTKRIMCTQSIAPFMEFI